MPRELREVHDSIWQEAVLLHLKWSILLQLYGTQGAVGLLNRSAPQFFAIGQVAWLQDIYLTFCRLTDPIQMAGRPNLCLERYVELIDPSTHASLRRKVADSVADLQTHCEFARDHRNRRIAHSDLLTKLGRTPKPLTPVTKAMIEGAFERIRVLVNEVEAGYGVPTTLFGFEPAGDGSELLLWLRHAEAFEAAARARDYAAFQPKPGLEETEQPGT
jgi:hypothetical protein